MDQDRQWIARMLLSGEVWFDIDWLKIFFVEWDERHTVPCGSSVDLSVFLHEVGFDKEQENCVFWSVAFRWFRLLLVLNSEVEQLPEVKCRSCWDWSHFPFWVIFVGRLLGELELNLLFLVDYLVGLFVDVKTDLWVVSCGDLEKLRQQCLDSFDSLLKISVLLQVSVCACISPLNFPIFPFDLLPLSPFLIDQPILLQFPPLITLLLPIPPCLLPTLPPPHNREPNLRHLSKRKPTSPLRIRPIQLHPNELLKGLVLITFEVFILWGFVVFETLSGWLVPVFCWDQQRVGVTDGLQLLRGEQVGGFYHLGGGVGN